MPTAISRRIGQSLLSLKSKDYEGALVSLFPAVDKTAKKRLPKGGVGKRIRSFLKDEEVLITAIGMGMVHKNVIVGGMSVGDALYKFGRNPIIHEGELDPMLSFITKGQITMGPSGWKLPVDYIPALQLAVILAPENNQEEIPGNLGLNLYNQHFLVNDLWGNPAPIYEMLAERHPNEYEACVA